MTTRETGPRPASNNKRKKRPPLTKKQKDERARERAEIQQGMIERAQARGGLIVRPFLDWCALRGISVATGRRLAKAGKVRLTQLSQRRVGVRDDHDQEYLDSCLRSAE
jgi:hypothetical protein